MMILVGVTVNVALNGGLFDIAKKASKDTQYEADREILQEIILGVLDRDLKITSMDVLRNKLPEGWDIKEETDGTYTVTSEKGNEYKVNQNGEINKTITSTADWWEFQGGEAEEVKETSFMNFGYDIAISKDERKALIRGKSEEQNLDLIYIADGSYAYVYMLNENTVQNMSGEKLEIKKWYKAENAQLLNLTEYTGSCPIAISDFTDGEIYSRSYLERVIENFNK